MRQFHEGISSKTFKKDNSSSLRLIDCVLVAIIGMVLSLSIQ